jgi:hypothetical protein
MERKAYLRFVCDVASQEAYQVSLFKSIQGTGDYLFKAASVRPERVVHFLRRPVPVKQIHSQPAILS